MKCELKPRPASICHVGILLSNDSFGKYAKLRYETRVQYERVHPDSVGDIKKSKNILVLRIPADQSSLLENGSTTSIKAKPSSLCRVNGIPHRIQERHSLIKRRIRTNQLRIRLPHARKPNKNLHHLRPRRRSRGIRHQEGSLVAGAGSSIETSDGELAFDSCFCLAIHAGEICKVFLLILLMIG